MKIISVRIKNFKAFKEEYFEFKNKNLIVAKNGVGKTSIIDAIFWSLTGKLSKGGTKGFTPRINDIASESKGSWNLDVKTSVTTIFEHNGIDYEICREFEHDAKHIGKSTILFGRVGELNKLTPSGLEMNFQTINLKLDTLHFLTNPDIIFNDSYSQNDLRKKFFDLAHQTIKKDLPPMPAEWGALSLSNFTKFIDEIDSELKSNQRLKEDKIEFLRIHENIQEDVGYLEKELSRLREVEKNSVSLTESNNVALNQLRTNYNTEKSIYDREQQKVVFLEKDITSLQEQVKKLEQEISNFVIDEESLKKQTIEIVKKLENDFKNKQTKVLEKAREDTRCKTCGQIIQTTIEKMNATNNVIETWDIATAKQKAKETFNFLKEEKNSYKSKILSLLESHKQGIVVKQSEIEKIKNLNVPNEVVFKEQEQSNLTRITNLKEAGVITQTKIMEFAMKIEKINGVVKTNEMLKKIEADMKEQISRKEKIQDYFTQAIRIITEFFNKNLKGISISMFNYTKTTNTLKEAFEIQELKNFANDSEMNNGARIRAAVEILLLLQQAQGLNLPIILDEASRLDELDFLETIENQIIVLETKRDLDNNEITIKYNFK